MVNVLKTLVVHCNEFYYWHILNIAKIGQFAKMTKLNTCSNSFLKVYLLSCMHCHLFKMQTLYFPDPAIPSSKNFIKYGLDLVFSSTCSLHVFIYDTLNKKTKHTYTFFSFHNSEYLVSCGLSINLHQYIMHEHSLLLQLY